MLAKSYKQLTDVDRSCYENEELINKGRQPFSYLCPNDITSLIRVQPGSGNTPLDLKALPSGSRDRSYKQESENRGLSIQFPLPAGLVWGESLGWGNRLAGIGLAPSERRNVHSSELSSH